MDKQKTFHFKTNIMRKILLLLTISILCFSCSQDDDTTNSASNDPILGTWGNYMDSILNGDVESPSETYDPYYEIANFYSDGTATAELNQGGTLIDATWQNLGNNNYQISILGFTETFNVQFICDENVMKWDKDDDGYYYYERINYNNSLCDEDDLTSGLTYIPDDWFEAKLEGLGLGDGDYENNYVLTSGPNPAVNSKSK